MSGSLGDTYGQKRPGHHRAGETNHERVKEKQKQFHIGVYNATLKQKFLLQKGYRFQYPLIFFVNSLEKTDNVC